MPAVGITRGTSYFNSHAAPRYRPHVTFVSKSVMVVVVVEQRKSLTPMANKINLLSLLGRVLVERWQWEAILKIGNWLESSNERTAV